MRLAWLAWLEEGDTEPSILFEEPGDWYHRKVRIVYSEIQE